MNWCFVILLHLVYLQIVAYRPILDPSLDLEGIDLDNNDHDCDCNLPAGRDADDDTLQPWQVNQGLCPPPLFDLGLCRTEDGDYVSPFFQGDIILGHGERTAMKEKQKEEEEKQKEKEKKKKKKNRCDEDGSGIETEQTQSDFGSRSRRAVHKNKIHWWKGGKIPYLIDEKFDEDTAKLIKRGLRHWEKRTCVQFIPKKDKDDDYIRIIYNPGCWSYVGRQGGEQLISFGPGCNVFGTVVHEVGHAIGLWHEQSRKDRDKYIKILWDNIASGTEDNFAIIPKENATTLSYAYDYESIMHYAPNAFSITGRPSIKIKKIGRSYGFKVGLQKALSAIDVAQVKGMYKCNKKDAATRKEKCVESKKGDGREYRGELDYTIDNVTCQHWNSQWPHKHKIYDTEDETINERRGIGAHNYCRNPSGHRKKPWCFTTLKDERWQYCKVKICKL